MVKPENKIKAGNISATIWNNIKEVNGEVKEIKSISLAKNYKDKEGNWKKSSNFSLYDLPKAILVLSKAFSELTIEDQKGL